MALKEELKKSLNHIANISDYIDTEAAAQSIRKNIYFKGPNLWILVFSIIIASVGLNMNSTAVIIGAMLISPLMGPIIGIGLGMGTSDRQLLREALINLGIMIAISLFVSVIYFLITPLKLANPSEIIARTHPTLFDVIIALAGGLAGIFELSRKEKGTVIAGAAIATALMPPLCTAGCGIASGEWSWFIGALLLFLMNGIFIVFATFMSVKYMGYKQMEYADEKAAKRSNRLMYAVMILVMIPATWMAVQMVVSNKFTTRVDNFITENRMLGNGYITDYEIDTKHGGSVVLYITGHEMTADQRSSLLASASKAGLKPEQIKFQENVIGNATDDASEKLMKGIYERTDFEISRKEKQILALEEELSKLKKEEIPYIQVSKEIMAQYPGISDAWIARGSSVKSDSVLVAVPGTVVVLKGKENLSGERRDRLVKWLQVRLSDENIELIELRN